MIQDLIKQGYKTHRHEQNPKEKEIHDLFIERFCKQREQVERIVLPIDENGSPKGTLTDNEIELVITAMQWIGSPVGQSFLRDCGFVNAT